MTRGSPPIPFVLRKLRGNPGKRPMKKPPEPAIEAKCPEPPAWLPPYAREEWWRTAPQLHVLGLLSSVDTACFSAYCSSYALWRQASEELEKLLIETQSGDQRRSPLIKIIADAARDMVSYASAFGMSPLARTRIAQGIHEAPSKFEGLLSEPS
jgi:P27 family predicted phage terminase small subunit